MIRAERFYTLAFVIDERLNKLLERTAQFHAAVHAHVGNLVPTDGKRYLVAFQAALLSLEHATGALVLIRHELNPSAYTLLRPQYECLTRGIWALYAASDTWIEKLAEPLTYENAKRANEGPMLVEMLKQLESSPNSPGPIVGQLKQYRDATWKAMNSYAHGGLHPLARTLTGYPAKLTYDVLRNSNAIVALTAQLASIVSFRQACMSFAEVLAMVSCHFSSIRRTADETHQGCDPYRRTYRTHRSSSSAFRALA